MGTLADVLASIERDQRLSSGRRNEYCGAIRTVCDILGRPPAAVPSVLDEIDQLLKSVPRAAHGRSQKTIANTRSRLKFALLYFKGIHLMPPRGVPLTPQWALLYDRLPDRRLQLGLSRFIRIASYRGIAPSDVNGEVLKAIVRDISTVNWGRDAARFTHTTATLWNEASERVDGWPHVELPLPIRPERVAHLPLDAFPATFTRDLDAYLRWCAGADPLAADAPDKPLKPSTIRLRREQLRIAASVLAQQFDGPEHVLDLATLVQPANAKMVLLAFIERDPDRKPSTFARGVAMTLLTVARHWIKLPADDKGLLELVRCKKKLGSTPTGLTEKNRELLRQLEDPRLRQKLLGLPDVLLAQVRKQRMSPARRLQRVQIALAIELLTAIPLRMKNLIELEIDRELQWPSGRAGPVFIVIRDDQSKNGQPLEFAVEGRVRSLLHEYLDHYRIHAKHGGSKQLFIRLSGEPVIDCALRDGITKAIQRELGIKMTPHQFRHLAATIVLDALPGSIGLVKDLLGHKNMKTTLNFYAGMRTRQAGQAYDQILAASRQARLKGQ